MIAYIRKGREKEIGRKGNASSTYGTVYPIIESPLGHGSWIRSVNFAWRVWFLISLESSCVGIRER